MSPPFNSGRVDLNWGPCSSSSGRDAVWGRLSLGPCVKWYGVMFLILKFNVLILN